VDIVPTILDAAGLTIPSKLAGQSLLPLFKKPSAKYREYLYTEKNADQIGMYYPRRAVRDKRYKLIYTSLDGRENEVARAYMREQNRGAAVAGSPKMSELTNAPASLIQVYKLWLNPPKILLYDLEKDPWEYRDLSSDPRYANVKKRLLSQLQAWQIKTDDPLRFPDKLQKLTNEMDTLKISKSMTLRYPEYLYDVK
jgi:arylsulfatase A-like enzyme